MENDKANKIDAAIDEVIQSKRLKQGFGFMFKTVFGLIATGLIFLIVLVMAGIIR
jgi:hypothetical protein